MNAEEVDRKVRGLRKRLDAVERHNAEHRALAVFSFARGALAGGMAMAVLFSAGWLTTLGSAIWMSLGFAAIATVLGPSVLVLAGARRRRRRLGFDG